MLSPLRVWNVASGNCLANLDVDNEKLRSFIFLQDNTIVTVSHKDGHTENQLWSYYKKNTCIIRRWKLDEGGKETLKDTGGNVCFDHRCPGRKGRRKTRYHQKNKTKKHILNLYNKRSISKTKRITKQKENN